MNFEYCQQLRATADIELDDPYNVCLLGRTVKQEEYYLYIKTVLGETQIVQYGPYVDGITPRFINCSYQRIPFNEKKICGIIDRFLNSNDIFQAEEVQLEDVKSCFENLIEKVI